MLHSQNSLGQDKELAALQAKRQVVLLRFPSIHGDDVGLVLFQDYQQVSCLNCAAASFTTVQSVRQMLFMHAALPNCVSVVHQLDLALCINWNVGASPRILVIFCTSSLAICIVQALRTCAAAVPPGPDSQATQRALHALHSVLQTHDSHASEMTVAQFQSPLHWHLQTVLKLLLPPPAASATPSAKARRQQQGASSAQNAVKLLTQQGFTIRHDRLGTQLVRLSLPGAGSVVRSLHTASAPHALPKCHVMFADV